MIPTSTLATVQIAAATPRSANARVRLIASVDGKPDLTALDSAWRTAAPALLDDAALGNAAEVRTIYARPLLITVGLGKLVDANALRDAGGLIARAAMKHRLGLTAIETGLFEPTLVAALTEGLVLGSFDARENKGKLDESKPHAAKFAIVVPRVSAELRTAVDQAVVVSLAQNFARTIAWRPGNVINPLTLAKLALTLGKQSGLAVRVLDDKQMARLGMGGILGVGKGSSTTPPRMIVLEHRGEGGAPLLLVGKSITFDTGGISIKPAERMGKMIFDKCGGMAVLGAMRAIAQLKLPTRVVGILAAAENHISGEAYRPGDVLRTYKGITVEVGNTDAEGRLVLADALAWGIEQYQPRAVVDLATLTGAMVVALGKTIAGYMSNHDGLSAELQAAAQRTGEKVWRLPLHAEHREAMKSKAADLNNTGGRDAGALKAAGFLQFFVPDETPWVHLDIAGTVDIEKETSVYAAGPTGWGVRTLVELAKASS